MPQRFKATEASFEKGIENTKANAGVKLIEAWEGEIESADFSGKKGIAGDLARLKKALQKDEPDEAAVKKILAKLGASTTKSADRAEGTVADKVRSLGEAMTGSGDGSTDHPEEDDDKDDAKK